MYQDQGAKVVSSPKSEVAFDTAEFRLTRINDERGKMIYEIEEKLHSIYNQRAPTANGLADGERPMDTDFVSKIHRQIGRAEDDNGRIQRILNHLNQIV